MTNTKQASLEKKRVSNIIKDWADKNKKVFWKYEVSSFYKSYVIKVANLPHPSSTNITVSKNNRLLNDQQKTQLCIAIEKARVKADVLSGSNIDVQIDYKNGAVIAEVI
ncbi:MAG TPA: hypothetical protein PK307_06415 [Spirochaetota bacterium]|nr:hypothetical protein [Spirochaetota bacterium]HOD14730.1 hypothetical protein [Spirochaetota bacterium]HPG51890.1 hypothetical protein [Spirochaetota bacterium]HPN12959.1 hypothetical protein [Spirochaetota bacterium]HQL81814.1 hypothetical protein [Spirochaetota bacterium]